MFTLHCTFALVWPTLFTANWCEWFCNHQGGHPKRCRGTLLTIDKSRMPLKSTWHIHINATLNSIYNVPSFLYVVSRSRRVIYTRGGCGCGCGLLSMVFRPWKGVIIANHHHNHLLPHQPHYFALVMFVLMWHRWRASPTFGENFEVATILTLQFDVHKDNITLISFEAKTFKAIIDYDLEDQPNHQPQPQRILIK